MENGEAVPLLIAAGAGGKAYLEDPENSLDQIFLEQYENDTSALGVNGKSGAAGTLSITIYFFLWYFFVKCQLIVFYGPKFIQLISSRIYKFLLIKALLRAKNVVHFIKPLKGAISFSVYHWNYL